MYHAVGALIAVALVVSGCTTSGDTSAPSPDGADVGPAVEVRPGSGIANGSKVTVTASGLEPETKVGVAQCLPERGERPSTETCALWRAGQLDVDQDGSASGSYVVHAFIRRGPPIETDCVVAECVIAIFDIDEEIVATAPIDWAENVQAPREPQVTVREQPGSFERREDGMFVTVTARGTHFVPDEKVKLTQCPTAVDGAVAEGPGDGIPVAGGDCLYNYGAEADADGDGVFTTEMELAVEFQRSNNELIDCRESDPQCLVVRTIIRDNPESRMVVTPFELSQP